MSILGLIPVKSESRREAAVRTTERIARLDPAEEDQASLRLLPRLPTWRDCRLQVRSCERVRSWADVDFQTVPISAIVVEKHDDCTASFSVDREKSIPSASTLNGELAEWRALIPALAP